METSNDPTQAVELVIFDMAGTTVRDDGEVEACFAESAEATGLDVSEADIRAAQGWSKREVFEVYWERQLGTRRDGWQGHVDSSFGTFKRVLEDHYRTADVAAADGCEEVFQYLQARGVKIGLTTGFYRKVADIILDRLGWLDGLGGDYVGGAHSLIGTSVTSDEVPRGRPAPDMIFEVMKRLGLQDAARIVKVGDTPSDLAAGRKAGCLASLGVTSGTHTEEQLADESNDGLLPDLKALIPFLRAQSRSEKAST